MKLLAKLAAGVSAATCLAAAAHAQEVSDGVVKIGILTDMSGTYSALAGPGSVVAAEMAVADYGGKVLGMPIELVVADHQNKADIAANTAREWATASRSTSLPNW